MTSTERTRAGQTNQVSQLKEAIPLSPAPPIGELMVRLADRLEHLQTGIEVLAERLEMVLAPTQPLPREIEKLNPGSRMAAFLRGAVQTVDEQIDRVADLTNRLEI